MAQGAIASFLDARSQARRFHRESIGAVNPEFCFADFLTSIGKRDYARLEKNYKATRTKAALSSGLSGVSGGWLVPTQFSQDLLFDVAEASIVRRLATVIGMTSGKLILPVIDAESNTGAVTGSPFALGGLRFRWNMENTAFPETDVKFRQLELSAKDLVGQVVLSNALMMDGGASPGGLDAMMRRLFARGLAYYEDQAFLTGDGVAKPLGLQSGLAVIASARASSTTVTFTDIAKMVGNFPVESRPYGVWVMSPSVLDYLLATPAAANNVTWDANTYGPVLPESPSAPPVVGFLHHMPVFLSEKVPVLGARGDVSLFDPNLYVIGDRQLLEIDISDNEPTAFLANRSVWRIIARVDGQPMFNVAFKPISGKTRSPYVVLAA